MPTTFTWSVKDTSLRLTNRGSGAKVVRTEVLQRTLLITLALSSRETSSRSASAERSNAARSRWAVRRAFFGRHVQERSLACGGKLGNRLSSPPGRLNDALGNVPTDIMGKAIVQGKADVV